MFISLLKRTFPCLGRFTPPWEKEGRSAEDFFGGILKSRNPLQRQTRDNEREYEALSEVMIARQQAVNAEEKRAAARNAETQHIETLRKKERDFLPYGCKAVEYFKDGFAAWGDYLGEGMSAYSGEQSQQLLRNDMAMKLPYKTPRDLSSWPLGGTVGVALDIDGVIYRSKKVIEGSDDAVKQLQNLKIPFVFMTNGGGCTEQHKAEELTRILNLENPIFPDQIVLSTSPMRGVAQRHAGENVLIVGAGDSVKAAADCGFSNPVGSLEYLADHPELCPYKRWGEGPKAAPNSKPFLSFDAVAVFGEPEDAFQDIQLSLDILLAPYGQYGKHVARGQTVPLYFAADDLLWSTDAPLPRLGLGAFREMLAATFLSVVGHELEVTQFGKPRAIAYAYAEQQLAKVSTRLGWDPAALRTICMVGDNLETDVLGANARKGKWMSVHVLSGVGSAPAAVRTISPGDDEMQWMMQVDGTPHYVAPTLDHFLRELLAFSEDVVLSSRRKHKDDYKMPNPVNLKDTYELEN